MHAFIVFHKDNLPGRDGHFIVLFLHSIGRDTKPVSLFGIKICFAFYFVYMYFFRDDVPWNNMTPVGKVFIIYPRVMVLQNLCYRPLALINNCIK